MGRQIRPARVFQTAKDFYASKIINDRIKGSETKRAPAWLKALESIPPSETMTRPYPIQHTPPPKDARRPRSIFRPTKIVYPEDELRQTFYRDHPWELARPMLVLEMDVTEARTRDWRTLEQKGMRLSGENVVQRQMYLMQHEGLTKNQAYDVARKEFYKVRQQEDIQRRVVLEEARHVGAYFGKNTLQYGMELEDRNYEHWKAFAKTEIERMQSLNSQEPQSNLPLLDAELETAEILK
ncbi:37S ribosomal protein Rsm25 [Podospora didyma]|uniref:Small ribosomal subunit protein mS23 n=1 Tax=Podospora didyma TaxID=330526 RepID=A0AAE0U1U6_9PEZI|nr:37S ribosomal protein Rsm25 [Podospora didyma]